MAPGGSTAQADEVRLPAGLPAGPGPAQPQEVRADPALMASG
ncbi:hypothetical protein HaLaN_24306, partial [Haematococcus lacustris]